MCSSIDVDLNNLAPCYHEEADTRLFLHAADAIKKGSRKLCIRTVDTDVVVIAISTFKDINPDKLWLAFGTGAKFWYISIHEVVTSMKPRICSTLPMLVDVILYLLSMEEVRRQHGILGKFILMLQKRLKNCR